MEPLERYRDIVDDFEAFLAACERSLPMAVRVNTLRATPEESMAAFEAEGIDVERVDWHPNVLVPDTDRPGSTWASYHGWTSGQEEVSTIPASVLDPEPGERVWDACAAPGSKTTQLAALMANEGTLVANDNNLGRLSALRFNTERLGVTNVVVTNRDARNYSLKPFQNDGDGASGDTDASGSDDAFAFDRVLVDAPCSCEGTIRKNPDALDDWNLGHVEQVASVQKGILRRAAQVTRPGGTIVYSTCTFAPEENEAVLDHVLAEEPVDVVDYDLPLEHVPGLTEFDGETYDPAVANAKRVYPHHNDTGGFFTAKLEVTAA